MLPATDELEAEVESLRGSTPANSQHRPDTAEGVIGTREVTAEVASVSNQLVRTAHDPPGSRSGNQGLTPASTHGSHREMLSQEKPEALSKPSDWVFQGTFARTASLVETRPPLDLVISSISVFFRHIHPWFPFLDSHSVLDDLAGIREPALLHYAIFGASIPFLCDPRLDDTRSDSFWKYTKRRIFVEASEEPSYATLEAATILTLDLSGMTNGPQVWSRLAVVSRLAAQLRTASGKVLRQSVPGNAWEDKTGGNRPSAKQHAKLIWCIYALDCFISITTSQPALLTQHTLRPFRPTREAAWSEPEPYGGAPDAVTYSPSVAFMYLLQVLDISRSFHELYLTYITLPRHDESQALSWLQDFNGMSGSADALLRSLPLWCQLPIDLEMSEPLHNHARCGSP